MSEVQLFIIETQVELERIFSYNNPRRGKASIKKSTGKSFTKNLRRGVFLSTSISSLKYINLSLNPFILDRFNSIAL
ncbi:hypothetical protein ABUT56_26040, partial [Escherichia coli]|uniref:hypothetical protein n=1 Tax=Escherichia coli TaxID=562 RepID=UPI0033555334